MKKITTVIIDDESLARKRIRNLLLSEEDISIIGESTNGREAVECIRKNSPDLIFLDVQMPGLDGFQVLEKIDLDHMPIIIFVTAYDQYAIKAFDVHAIDYLLKPFDDERFALSLNRAREQFFNSQNSVFNRKVLNLLDNLARNRLDEMILSSLDKSESKFLERIVVKSSGRIYFLKTCEIERIKAAGKYLEIKVGKQEHLIRQTLNEIESKLNPHQFLRIHRSAIVNIDFIKELQHWYKSQYMIILKSGEQLISSKGYHKNIEKILTLSV